MKRRRDSTRNKRSPSPRNPQHALEALLQSALRLYPDFLIFLIHVFPIILAILSSRASVAKEYDVFD